MKAQAILAVVGVALAVVAPQVPPNVCPIDPQTKKITYQGVVTMENVTAAELYSRAKLWITSTYRSGQDTIDLDDKDAGRIVVKRTSTLTDITYQTKWVRNVRTRLTIEVKNGQYRYILTDLVLIDPSGKNPDIPVEKMSSPRYGWYSMDALCHGIIAYLTKAMSTPATTKKR